MSTWWKYGKSAQCLQDENNVKVQVKNIRAFGLGTKLLTSRCTYELLFYIIYLSRIVESCIIVMVWLEFSNKCYIVFSG